MKEILPPVIGKILRLESISGGYVVADIDAPEVAARARPGQFVHLRFPDRNVPLLRRPLSIAGAEKGCVRLLVKVKGEFTRGLASLGPGDRLDILGPLGNGFDLSFEPVRTAILVAGGYGIAPLIFLAEGIKKARKVGHIVLIEGARDGGALVWAERAKTIAGLDFIPATEDGSVGTRGTALDALAGVLSGGNGHFRLFACGPMGMLAQIHKRWPDIPMQAAGENRMGCGFGICQGCVLPARGRTGAERYVRICRDGPVFPGDAIDWEECPA